MHFAVQGLDNRDHSSAIHVDQTQVTSTNACQRIPILPVATRDDNPAVQPLIVSAEPAV